MLRWFLRRQIAAFEQTWDYDASYLHELIDADLDAMLAFGKLQAISRYRKDVPPAGYCGAGIVASWPRIADPAHSLGSTWASGARRSRCAARHCRARLRGDALRGGAGCTLC